MKKLIILFNLLISISSINLYSNCYDSLYLKTISFIKMHEGFRSCEYIIEGKSTIGYGHLIKKGESFNCLTKKQADSLLIKDLNSSINLAKKYIKTKGSRLLSISHFIYCKGIGNFLKSSIYFKIINNIELLEEDFLKYRFKKNRQYEWELWKLNCF